MMLEPGGVVAGAGDRPRAAGARAGAGLPRDGGDPQVGARAALAGAQDGGRGGRRAGGPARRARGAARHARAARRRQRHPSVRRLAGGARVHRAALPARVRLDARARAPGAHVRAPRARGRRDADAAIDLLNRHARATCRCCWRCRPTRRSGRGATPAWPPPARRSSRPSRAWASRGRSATTRDWVEAVDVLLRCEAFEEPTFLWWDVRPQPRFGTVEVRILDAQSTVAETVGLTALVQCIARLELEEGYHAARGARPPGAARGEPLHRHPRRDGRAHARPGPRGRSCRRGSSWTCCWRPALPHAQALGCVDELLSVRALAEGTGAARQLELARGDDGLPGPGVGPGRAVHLATPWPGPEGEPAPGVGLHASGRLRPTRAPARARARAWPPRAAAARERRGVWREPGTRR